MCVSVEFVCCLHVVATANSVYMYDAPPPYPGIDPNLSAYPPPPQVNGHYPPPAAAASAPYPDGPQNSAAGTSIVVFICFSIHGESKNRRCILVCNMVRY